MAFGKPNFDLHEHYQNQNLARKKLFNLSAIRTHCSPSTNVHLNRNKNNYKSSLGMEIGVPRDDRRQIAPNIAPVPPPSVKELVETHQSS